MTQSFVLFAHVVGVLALFVGLGLEWITEDALRRSTSRADAAHWVHMSTIVPRATGIALAVIVASGFYLGARFGVLGNAWMRASYGALLLMGIVSGPMTRAPIHSLREAARRLSLPLRVVFGLGVVYLMIRKPDAGESLLVIGLAAALTLALNLSRRNAAVERVIDRRNPHVA